MTTPDRKTSSAGRPAGLRSRLQALPLLALLLGFLVCVLVEQALGERLADLLRLPKIPVLFGILTISKVAAGVINALFKGAAFVPATLAHIPAVLVYVALIYILPLAVVVRLTATAANRAAGRMARMPLALAAAVHLGLMYATLHIWAGMSDYRLITLNLTLIAVLLTLSLNIINGYMGEFSCSHPGFMAIGAYISSLFTVGLFVDDRVLGPALVHLPMAYLTFPLWPWWREAPPPPSAPCWWPSRVSRPAATTWPSSASPSCSSSRASSRTSRPWADPGASPASPPGRCCR